MTHRLPYLPPFTHTSNMVLDSRRRPVCVIAPGIQFRDEEGRAEAIRHTYAATIAALLTLQAEIVILAIKGRDLHEFASSDPDRFLIETEIRNCSNRILKGLSGYGQLEEFEEGLSVLGGSAVLSLSPLQRLWLRVRDWRSVLRDLLWR